MTLYPGVCRTQSQVAYRACVGVRRAFVSMQGISYVILATRHSKLVQPPTSTHYLQLQDVASCDAPWEAAHFWPRFSGMTTSPVLVIAQRQVPHRHLRYPRIARSPSSTAMARQKKTPLARLQKETAMA